MLTKTEIINKAFDGIIKQGRKSLASYSDTRCLYRGVEGTKCAVGQLIPDELYDGDMEEIAITEEGSALWKALEGVGCNYDSHMDLLKNIQKVHDLKTVAEWPEYKEFYLKKHKDQ